MARARLGAVDDAVAREEAAARVGRPAPVVVVGGAVDRRAQIFRLPEADRVAARAEDVEAAVVEVAVAREVERLGGVVVVGRHLVGDAVDHGAEVARERKVRRVGVERPLSAVQVEPAVPVEPVAREQQHLPLTLAVGEGLRRRRRVGRVDVARQRLRARPLAALPAHRHVQRAGRGRLAHVRALVAEREVEAVARRTERARPDVLAAHHGKLLGQARLAPQPPLEVAAVHARLAGQAVAEVVQRRLRQRHRRQLVVRAVHPGVQLPHHELAARLPAFLPGEVDALNLQLDDVGHHGAVVAVVAREVVEVLAHGVLVAARLLQAARALEARQRVVVHVLRDDGVEALGACIVLDEVVQLGRVEGQLLALRLREVGPLEFARGLRVHRVRLEALAQFAVGLVAEVRVGVGRGLRQNGARRRGQRRRREERE